MRDLKAISIHSLWYDVTNFHQNHPGGDIILRFIHKDATSYFYGMHNNPEKILKCFKPIGRSNLVGHRPDVTHDFVKLITRYYDIGVMHSPHTWIARI